MLVVIRAAASDSYLTPPELAHRWGVSAEQVIGWIRRGELRAVNLAARANGARPRFKISPDAVAAFEVARSTQPAPRPARRRRRASSGAEVEQFF